MEHSEHHGREKIPCLMVRVEQALIFMHQYVYSWEIKQEQRKCLVLQSPINSGKRKSKKLKTTRAQKSFIALSVSFLGLGRKVKQ